MTETEKRVPELRFKGFIEDWEQRKLEKVLHERKLRKKISEETPLLAFAAGQGVIDRSERKTNNRDFLTKDSSTKTYLLTKYDDIVYNPSNLKYGAIDRNKHGQGVISPIYVTFETEEVSSFIELIVRGDSFKQRALQYEEGTVTKRQSVKPESLLSLSIALPISKMEQQQIGDFFKQLDDTIALHQRKLNLLKQLKQTYLQQLFPQNEENIPALRFAGFSDIWEQRKLGDLAESFEYGLNASAKIYDGENKYIRITDIDESSHLFLQKNLTSPDTDLSTANNYLLETGDLLFARTGASVGKSYQYNITDGKVYFAGFLIRVRIRTEFNSSFIFQNTLTSNYQNFIKITSQRSGQPGVNAQEYATFNVVIPTKKEQDQLGRFFEQLDKTIAVHQCKFAKLLELKNALLGKMFL